MNYHHAYDADVVPPMPSLPSTGDQVVPNAQTANGGQGYRASASARLYPKKHNMLGPYVMLQTVGEGEFAKVKLGMHVDTGDEAST
jgi:hypothetical protein